MMFEEFTYNGINWKGNGYFGCPSPSSDYTSPSDVRKDHLDTWIDSFQRSKEGDFSKLHLLIDILLDTAPSPIAASCSALIGDAGNSQCFQRILEELKKTRKFFVAELLCQSLCQRGTINDISTLLETYESYCKNTDAKILTVWISDLLGRRNHPYSEPMAFGGIQEYRKAVMNHVGELTTKFSTKEKNVFQGAKFDVCKLSEYALERIKQPYFRSDLRQRFEAATGINCSGFYHNGQLQPLAAAAIIEGFLESDEASNFEEGVRYFFGHRIPV